MDEDAARAIAVLVIYVSASEALADSACDREARAKKLEAEPPSPEAG